MTTAAAPKPAYAQRQPNDAVMIVMNTGTQPPEMARPIRSTPSAMPRERSNRSTTALDHTTEVMLGATTANSVNAAYQVHSAGPLKPTRANATPKAQTPVNATGRAPSLSISHPVAGVISSPTVVTMNTPVET